MEAQQLRVLQEELDRVRSSMQQQDTAYSQLREAFATVHTCLSPQALAAACSYQEQYMSGFAMGMDEYRQVGRLLTC